MPTLTSRITALFRRRKADSEPEKRTTAQEIPAPPSSPVDFAERLRAERERARIVRICDEMYDTDPRVEGAINKLARDTVRGGFSVSVVGNTKAEDIVKRLDRRIGMMQRIDDWCRETYIEGDSLLEISVDEDEEIADITRKPTLPTRRASDRTDRFPDPSKAFWYHDGPVFSVEPPADAIWFAQWQVVHARWAHRSKRKYGRPLFASAISAWKRVKEGELDIAVRRKTRAGLKYLHVVEGADETAMKAYRENNKDALNNPFSAIADFFSNKPGSIKAIEGDARLNEIDDVVHHIETLWTASPVPLAAVGYGQNLNRDILEDKLREYEGALEEITQWCEDQMVRPIIEREWLLHSVYPDSLEYEVIWKNKSITTAKDLRDVADAIVRFQAIGAPVELIWAIVARWLPWLDLTSVVGVDAKDDEGNDGDDGDDADEQSVRLAAAEAA